MAHTFTFTEEDQLNLDDCPNGTRVLTPGQGLSYGLSYGPGYGYSHGGISYGPRTTQTSNFLPATSHQCMTYHAATLGWPNSPQLSCARMLVELQPKLCQQSVYSRSKLG
ncbi:hypothetical protein PSTG_04335 [Puccinia striiformis f. sp. tritici PST-78]|uniref:Uncharacterized protein n=1 Tax=Puccinia striiformis f. sp. tritici PST-78 TaxID=1165861 RepID=A0A0L0VT25_9BASI|nr:hypothetical protein PSTG_04335 [Puccinia striiformis f. sp. tritici PST-78]